MGATPGGRPGARSAVAGASPVPAPTGGLESQAGAAHRFSCFDGLRALAATAVLAHHAGFQTGASFKGGVGPYLARMDAGVSVFFLVSGFLLYRPFATAHLGGRPAPAAGAFWRRRALRIFPAYWVALSGVALFFGLRFSGWQDVVAFYGLVQIYDADRFNGGITQAWSLATEVSFYAFLPLWAWAVRRGAAARREAGDRVRLEAAGLAALFAAGVAWKVGLYAADPPWRDVAAYWLPAYLDLFAVGMGLALASAWLGASGRPAPRAVAAAVRHPGWCWALAAASFWAVTMRLGLPVGLSPIPGPQDLARHLLYGLTAVGLVLPAAFGGDEGGSVRRLLRARPVVFVGTVSYGIYLWHQAWLGEVRERVVEPVASSAVGDPRLFRGSFWLVATLTFVASTATAWASWRLIERPALRWKDARPALRWRDGRPRRARVPETTG